MEDILEDVESGKQSTDGIAVKHRLLMDGIDETIAGDVIRLCILQGRFQEATTKLTSSSSHFSHLRILDAPEREWFGALHYVELVDCTEDAHKKSHACFVATVPRIGELVTPPNGSQMRVVDVEWLLVEQDDDSESAQNILVPHVYLECESDANDDE